MKPEVANFFEDLHEVLSKHDEAYVGVTGGTSLDGFYKEITEAWSGADLSRVRFFLSDERVTDIEADLNIARIQETFFKPLEKKTGIKPDVFVPRSAGKFPFPRSDILLLSAGPDGHISSLFPGHALLNVNGWSYLSIEDSPKPPPHRITMSAEVIRRSGSVLLFFVGQAKKQAYENRMSLPTKIAIEPGAPGLKRRVFNYST